MSGTTFPNILSVGKYVYVSNHILDKPAQNIICQAIPNEDKFSLGQDVADKIQAKLSNLNDLEQIR